MGEGNGVTGTHVKGANLPALLEVTIGELLAATASRLPDATALIVRHQSIRWTYAELLARVDDLARGFVAAGLRPGDRIKRRRRPSTSSSPAARQGLAQGRDAHPPTTSSTTAISSHRRSA
jgi:non-ribosomal peptide synthetase component F